MANALTILILACLTSRPLPCVEERWYDPAFLEAASQDAGTGFLLTPSPEIIPGGVIFAAIHRYQFKLGYGLWERLELGITTDLDGFQLSRGDLRTVLYAARLRLLSRACCGLSVSLGADGVGLEDLGGQALGFLPDARLLGRDRLYAVAGALLPFLPSLMLSLGWGSGSRPAHYFGTASWVLWSGLLAVAEYDGLGTNLGARLLLSPRVKLDLAFLHTQKLNPNEPFARVLEHNLRFGVSYSETFPAPQEK